MAKVATKPVSAAESLAKLKTVLNRRAGIIFIVFVLGVVVYSVSSVNLLINMPSDEEYRSQKQQELTSTQFNTKTIDRIEALGDRNNPPTTTLPGGRINPFIE